MHLMYMKSVSCLTVGPMEVPVAVVAAAKDMTRTELLFARLAAQMVPDKERSTFERALVSGWSSINEILDQKASKLDMILYYVHDARIPRIDSYPQFVEKGLDCFALEGSYYDVDRKCMQPCTLKQVMSDAAHPAHYSRRSLVFTGETRDGKTFLARVLARRLAVMHQRETNMQLRKFLVVRGVEQLKSEAVQAHLEPQVPVVFDDLMPGKAMHVNAEPTSFLKNLFEPVSGELYCRYTCAQLAPAPRLFTTNEGDMDKWLALRSESGELTKAHKDAVMARAVFFKTLGRLYSEAQSAGSNLESAAENMLAQCELAKCTRWGF